MDTIELLKEARNQIEHMGKQLNDKGRGGTGTGNSVLSKIDAHLQELEIPVTEIEVSMVISKNPEAGAMALDPTEDSVYKLFESMCHRAGWHMGGAVKDITAKK